MLKLFLDLLADKDQKKNPDAGVHFERVKGFPVRAMDLFSGKPELMHESVNCPDVLMIVTVHSVL
jgi:hypothetical protein